MFSTRGRRCVLRACTGQTGSGWLGLIRGGCFLSTTSQFPHPTPKPDETQAQTQEVILHPPIPWKYIIALVSFPPPSLSTFGAVLLSSAALENRTNWNQKSRQKVEWRSFPSIVRAESDSHDPSGGVKKKLKVVFCSFLLIVHTSVLGVKYFPCNCGSFKACNPAPSHYHGNLDWKLDVKKKKFGGLAETTLLLPASIYAFILLLWEVFGWDFASNLGVLLTVFPAEISPTYFFPLQEYTERGGKRSGCLKVCGRHVVHRWEWVCSEIRALKCALSTSLQNDWQSVNIWFTSETLEIGKDSQRRKSSNGVVLVVIGEGGGLVGKKCKQIRS